MNFSYWKFLLERKIVVIRNGNKIFFTLPPSHPLHMHRCLVCVTLCMYRPLGESSVCRVCWPTQWCVCPNLTAISMSLSLTDPAGARASCSQHDAEPRSVALQSCGFNSNDSVVSRGNKVAWLSFLQVTYIVRYIVFPHCVRWVCKSFVVELFWVVWIS